MEIDKQGLAIGEFLRVELVEKRGLHIYSAMSEQKVEELPFQPVSSIQIHYDHPGPGLEGSAGEEDHGDHGTPLRAPPHFPLPVPQNRGQVGGLDPDGRLTAPRLDFEVAGKNVEYEDVNDKEHRLADLSRFVAQMAPPTLFNLVAAPRSMQPLRALARWVPENQKIFDVFAGGRLPLRRRNFERRRVALDLRLAGSTSN